MSPDSVRRGMHRLGIAIGALICLPLAIVAFLAASESAALAVSVGMAVALAGAFYGATRLIGWIIVGFMRDETSISRLPSNDKNSNTTLHSIKVIGVGIMVFAIIGIFISFVFPIIVELGEIISGHSETQVEWVLVIAMVAWVAYNVLREWYDVLRGWAEERVRKRERDRRHGGQ